MLRQKMMVQLGLIYNIMDFNIPKPKILQSIKESSILSVFFRKR